MSESLAVSASRFVLTSGTSTLFAELLAGLLAGIFAVVGILYGSRREHQQWLRDTRRTAYWTLLTNSQRVQSVRQIGLQLEDAERESLYSDLYSAVNAVQIAGPKKLAEAAELLMNAVNGTDYDALIKTKGRFVELAREVLEK